LKIVYKVTFWYIWNVSVDGARMTFFTVQNNNLLLQTPKFEYLSKTFSDINGQTVSLCLAQGWHCYFAQNPEKQWYQPQKTPKFPFSELYLEAKMRIKLSELLFYFVKKMSSIRQQSWNIWRKIMPITHKL